MSLATFAVCAVAAPAVPAGAQPDLLRAALDGPLRDVEHIIFANRSSYEDGHWYANIGYYGNDETHKAYAGNGKPDVGRLCRLNLRTGELTVLVDARGGSIRDPVVHYEAEKILFAWRKPGSDLYHLYEINVDGGGLRQLTDGEYDDYEPAYLPDGDIVFVSTRCKRWVQCWKTQVGTLYRCGPNGENVRPISANLEHDNTPAVLPDGRILYTRWEYVDRSQVGYHHLWTINPDGTGQMAYYGNQQHYPLYISAMPIPGTRKVVGTDSPGHGRRDHYGHVVVFDPSLGPDDPRAARRISDGRQMYTDPYPLTEDLFLVAQGNNILLMNGRGQTQVVHRSDRMCFEPRPVMPRPRERVMSPRTHPTGNSGQLVLIDVYRGRKMAGVKRGDIKKLLVLEVLPKPVNFSGGPDLISWLGTFTLERVLGTVPVEEDGSASFEVPANRAIFFVALDENDLSVKRMQSFVSVMPGEVTSCVGCHEPRSQTPPAVKAGQLQALQREPSRIQRFDGHPDVLDFHRDIQPILDRHCVACHSFAKPEGNLVLEGDLGPQWSLSFYALFARLLVADGRNGYGNQPPRTIGSSASPLLKTITPAKDSGQGSSHYGVKVSDREWRTVWLWIESAAPYAGSYAALRNEAEMALFGGGLRPVAEQGDVLRRRCAGCHGKGELPAVPFGEPPWPDTRGITRPLARHERRVVENDPLARFGLHAIINMTRPELSPLLLGPLARDAGGWGSCGEVFADTSDTDYQRLLQSLKRGKQARDAIPRYATPGWRPNRQYVREMKRFGVLPASFDLSRDQIDPFETDQSYWRSLW
ncbi:MAG: hypothetical protein ACE5R4_12790 [Armatimonadota bacterium]